MMNKAIQQIHQDLSRFESPMTRTLNISPDEVTLSKKQESVLSSRVVKHIKTLSRVYIDESTESKRYWEIYKHFWISKRNSEFSKISKLNNILILQLDNIRNNFPKLISRYQYEKEFWSNEYGRDFTDSDLLSHFKSVAGEYYKDFKKILRELSYLSTNISYAYVAYLTFLDTKCVIYLQESVNLLKTACRYKIVLKSPVTNYIDSSINYSSRSKFCAWSNEQRVFQYKFLLNKSIAWYEKEDCTFSFLTLSPKNLIDPTKEDFDSMCLVLKNFWRDKRISKIFKGYFGVPELVQKPNLQWNLHFHFLVLRPKSFQEGFIDKRLLSQIFAEKCNKFGNNKIKGSKIIDIRAPHMLGIQDVGQAVNYILSYIGKGLKIQTLQGQQQLYLLLNGVRFIRSGGYLSLSKLQELSINEEVVNQLKSYTFYGLQGIPMYVGGREINSSEVLPQIQISPNLLSGISPESINSYRLKLLYSEHSCNIKTHKLKYVKSPLYKEIQQSMFSTKSFVCPFAALEVLKFQGTGSNFTRTNWKEPMFVVDALSGLGLENESKKFQLLSGFPDDIDFWVEKSTGDY